MRINTCFITDDGYAMQTCIAIHSISKNRNKNNEYYVYILCNNVSKNNQEKFEQLNDNGFNIKIIELLGNDEYLKYDIKGIPASPTAIYKFSIPQILKDIDKVLYLDGDLIVKNDLEELFNYNLSGKCIGAVKDTSGLARGLYKVFMNKKVFYFNSGVMLMDLNKMRENDYTAKLIDYRINGYNEYMDQDALNYILKDDVVELPFKYNTQLLFLSICNEFDKIYAYLSLNNNERNKEEVVKEAEIIHYSGNKKPWRHTDGAEHELWTYYYYSSPYKEVMLNRTYGNVKKKKISVLDKINRKKKTIRRNKFMEKLV